MIIQNLTTVSAKLQVLISFNLDDSPSAHLSLWHLFSPTLPSLPPPFHVFQ